MDIDIYLKSKQHIVVVEDMRHLPSASIQISGGYENNKDYLYIGTHDNTFHADEVLACAMIALAHPDKDILILRSRNSGDLKQCKYVIDVEGGQFDHHQKDFNQYRENGVKYASAGLVWKEVGYSITIGKHTELDGKPEAIQRVIDKIDAQLIQGVDAIDNGQLNMVTGEIPALTFSHIISGFNPIEYDPSTYERLIAFKQAVILTIGILSNIVKTEVQRELFSQTVLVAAKECTDGVMILKEGGPWISTVVDHWDEFRLVRLCVYPSGNEWHVKTLPFLSTNIQSMRCPAPKKWKGLRNNKLDSVTRLTDTTFIHPNGFMGGAKTFESALDLAKLWIKEDESYYDEIL